MGVSGPLVGTTWGGEGGQRGPWPRGDSQAPEGPELCPVAQGGSETWGSGRGKGACPHPRNWQTFTRCLSTASTERGPGYRSRPQP